MAMTALGSGHLVVDVFEDLGVSGIDRARHDEDVGVLGVADIENAEAFDVVDRGETGQDLDVAPVAASTIEMDEPRGLHPGFVQQFLKKPISELRSLSA